jgi:dihydroorotate dehydrogenase
MYTRPHLLPVEPVVPDEIRRRVCEDFERFAHSGQPHPLEDYLLEAYRLDVQSTYAGLRIRNPWGKASGQLSMSLAQVEEDVAAGLGFIVLKTVIAEDETGCRTMAAWAIPEARMVVEPITGQGGDSGWTVTWKGRGWWQSLDAYLTLVSQATAAGKESGTLVVPSCKYHLPPPGETIWRVSEYEYTTRRIAEAAGLDPLPLEKDFSPTLAGSELAQQQSQIRLWLDRVPQLIRAAAAPRRVRVGLKLFNALFDDAFQVEMLTQVHGAGAARPDYLIYGNRLIDPEKVFDGKKGIACGGPDLSDRNLRVLDRFRERTRASSSGEPALEISGTGNIHSGKMALEYALRGCTSFQLHTLFQLPQTEYFLRVGSRTEKVLHLLNFHPTEGFVVWMYHLAQQYPLRDSSGIIRFSRLHEHLR